MQRNENVTIKEMYREERPYEKCEQYGAENLTDAELLAVLLRTGTKGENSLRLAQKIHGAVLDLGGNIGGETKIRIFSFLATATVDDMAVDAGAGDVFFFHYRFLPSH